MNGARGLARRRISGGALWMLQVGAPPTLAPYLRIRLRSRPPLAVTLDVDDTLVDTRNSLAHAVTAGSNLAAARTNVNAAALAHAYHRAHDAFWTRPAAVTGRSAQELWRNHWRLALRAVDASLDEAHLHELVRTCIATQLAAIQPDPELPGLLRALAGRVPLAVCSNSPTAATRAKLTRAGLAGSISAVVCAPEAGVAKPDRRLFHLSCQAIDADPARCLHLGDNWDADIRGAHDAGLTPIWINPKPADNPPNTPPVPRYPTVTQAIRELLPLLPHPPRHQPSATTSTPS